MTIACGPPDASLGVVIRSSRYLACQGRALGENGFLSVIDGPADHVLLTALVTIFVAVIGYGLILGRSPSLRDGVGWALRLGLVLALVTGWSAFQTLFYAIAIDGPLELTSVVLPSVGLSAEDIDGRVQQAYDTLRLGGAAQQPPVAATTTLDPQSAASTVPPAPQPAATGPFVQPPLPTTATVFAASTVGVMSAYTVVTGLLLALGPFAILGLLFAATTGLFFGWVRALAICIVGLVVATAVSVLGLTLVEGELGNWQSLDLGVSVIDTQGLTTIVMGLVPVMLVGLVLAGRAVGLVTPLAVPHSIDGGIVSSHGIGRLIRADDRASGRPSTLVTTSAGVSRATLISETLATSMRRERGGAGSPGGIGSVSGRSGPERSVTSRGDVGHGGGLGPRRTGMRRTRSSAARDRA